MKKDYSNLPFEFIFKINGNPIVARNFWVNGYNNKSTRSIELKEMIDDVVRIIHKDFMSKTEDYLYKYYDPYAEREEILEQMSQGERNIFENEDFYQVVVLHKGRTLITKEFTGNIYPPKVRYDVDIRKIIPKIIESIQNSLSLKNYTREYAGQEL
jgi:hypothetical protein